MGTPYLISDVLGDVRILWCTNNFLLNSANYLVHQRPLSPRPTPLSSSTIVFFVPRAAAIAARSRLFLSFV
jgi:hypothetical protein